MDGRCSLAARERRRRPRPRRRSISAQLQEGDTEKVLKDYPDIKIVAGHYNGEDALGPEQSGVAALRRRPAGRRYPTQGYGSGALFEALEGREPSDGAGGGLLDNVAVLTRAETSRSASGSNPAHPLLRGDQARGSRILDTGKRRRTARSRSKATSSPRRRSRVSVPGTKMQAIEVGVNAFPDQRPAERCRSRPTGQRSLQPKPLEPNNPTHPNRLPANPVGRHLVRVEGTEHLTWNWSSPPACRNVTAASSR